MQVNIYKMNNKPSYTMKNGFKKLADVMFWVAILAISIDAAISFVNKNFTSFVWKALVVCWMVYSSILECELKRLRESIKDYRKKLNLED